MCICVNAKKDLMPVQLKLAYLTFTSMLLSYILAYKVSKQRSSDSLCHGTLSENLGEVTNIYIPSQILGSLLDGCLA